jgi:pilus assembly protein Flp/PilA
MNTLHWLPARITGTVRHASVRGQGLVEYALILVLIAIVTVGVLTEVGGSTSQTFSKVNCTLDSGAVVSSSHPGDPQGDGGGLGNNTTTTGGC